MFAKLTYRKRGAARLLSGELERDERQNEMATHYIAAVHMSGGTSHEHISQIVWVNGTTFASGLSSAADMVKFIDDGGDVGFSDGSTRVTVGVVHPQRGTPYLRTHEDKKWTDNLLAAPRY